MPALSLSAIADLLEGVLDGPPDHMVTGVGTPSCQEEDRIVAVFADAVPESVGASVAVVVRPDAETGGRPAVRVANPRLALARLLATLHAVPQPEPGVHPSAVVHPEARLGAGVSVGAGAVLGVCELGEGVIVSPLCYIGDGVRIGAGTLLHPRVTVLRDCTVGARCILHAGAVVGADGFGFEPGPAGLVRVPHVGAVIVGDDVEIGALTAVDRATLPGEVTTIGSGAKVDNLCQIAHNCTIGRHAVLCGCTGVAGSVTIGDGAVLGGSVMVRDHVTVGAGAQVGGGSGLMQDVEAGASVFGFPARPVQQELRVIASLGRLPELAQRVRELEKRLERMGAQQSQRHGSEG